MEKITDPAKLKAATTYNAAADHFDDGPLAFWDRYGRRTIERLRLKPGSVVLDVGCGSGASAIPAGKVVGPRGHVIGVDLAERLLAMARAKADEQKLLNITFRQADMEGLDYSGESFDAVVRPCLGRSWLEHSSRCRWSGFSVPRRQLDTRAVCPRSIKA